MINKKYQETITPEQINEFELTWFKGRIEVIDNMKAFNNAIKLLKEERILGFDTETRPSFKKGHRNKVSLMQLATDNVACLFRLNKIGMPEELSSILADPKIVKSGVAVHDDIKFLKSINGFVPSGFVDLQHFVKDFGIQSSGLKKLAAIVLGYRISKNQQVSDWAADELNEAQLIYAATDAWICRAIYQKLVSEYHEHVSDLSLKE